MMEKWFLPKISDYWHTNEDVRHPLCDAVQQTQGEKRTVLLQHISDSIKEHVRVLSDKDLCLAAFIMVDDLYKSLNSIIVYDDAIRQYLEASAGVFSSLLSKRGYAVHYIINNGFPNTEIGMQRPLDIFPLWFRDIGLVYICPQKVALDL